VTVRRLRWLVECVFNWSPTRDSEATTASSYDADVRPVNVQQTLVMYQQGQVSQHVEGYT